MFGRWTHWLWFSVAQFCLNVMRPGRDTLGIRQHLPSFSEGVGIGLAAFTLIWLITLCGIGVRCFAVLCCNPNPNGPEIQMDGIPFRYYRGKSWKQRRKRVPTYHTRDRKGRKAAIQFLKGLGEPEPPPKAPRHAQREQARRLAKLTWHQLRPPEAARNRDDEFERIKPRFLHNSYVMYDLQFGVNLDEFVKSIDPVRDYRNQCELSRPDCLRATSTKHLEKDFLDRALSEAARWRNTTPIQHCRLCCLIDWLSGGWTTLPCNILRAEVGGPAPASVYISGKEPELPVVIDSGASFSLTPTINDFITPIRPSKTKLSGLEGETVVAGVGTVEWIIQDVNGLIQKIRCEAFYVPQAQIRLFSPQQYFMQHCGGHLYMDEQKTLLTCVNGAVMQFPYDQGSRLPMMLTRDALMEPPTQAGLSLEECQFLATTHALPSIVDTTNLNLTSSQKELLLWHQKLGHANMSWLQSLAATPRTRDDVHSKPVLPTRPGSRMSSCERPLCTACQLSKQSRRTREGAKQRTGGQGMAIRKGALEPGECVSIDQYQSSFPGCLEHTKGKEPKKVQRTGGTMFVDHASGLTYIVHQVSLTVAETIRAKRQFEAFAKEHGVTVKAYRADNVPFGNEAFKAEVRACNQTIDFSGVGAHHQNGVAERAIGTITRFARAMLLHQAIMWPDRTDLKHWPFAMDHATFLWNHLPRENGKLAPIELFTGVMLESYAAITKAHVWGCPVYVLDPKLQDGKKLPKWDPRARRGMYLGVSGAHSSLSIARVLNLRTGHISPQFHMVFDDKFTTINNSEGAGLVEPTRFDADHWEHIVETGYEMYLDPFEPQVPDLDDTWLTPHERRIRLQRRDQRRARATVGPPQVPSEGEPQRGEAPVRANQLAPQPPQPDVPLEGAIERDDDDVSVVEEPLTTPDEEPFIPTPREVAEQHRRARRSVRDRKKPTRMTTDRFGEWTNFAKTRYSTKTKAGRLDSAFVQGLKWAEFVEDLKGGIGAYTQLLRNMDFDPEFGTVESWHPLILATKMDSASSADNPTWEQAMNGPDRDGYMKAAEMEIDTLRRKDTWDEVDREDWMNVLPSTWAFKCKRFPDGSVRKFKGRFCVRGDRQIEGVDFFETFSPVVNWTTVRLLLIMSVVLRLATSQADYTAAFVQSPIDKDPNWDNMTEEERAQSGVYVEMPRGFRVPGKVLRLKRSLYGLRQSPRNFFQYLKGNLEQAGFTAMTDVDPCLFVSDKVICLSYVDDTLWFSPKQEYIDEAMQKLREQGMDLEKEDDVAGFLGVHMEQRGDSIKLTQRGLTRRIIEALGVDNVTANTPASEPLPMDVDGDPPNGKYSYPSVIGMLQYLQAHSRPDITMAVSQCARFVHSPKRSHEEALERIGAYLHKTEDEGLILRPSDHFEIDCYVDADFAGLWGYENPLEPSVAKSRTGFVICISNCPVIWTSKLQSSIALSTMESEYNALSMAMRDLIPFRNVALAVGSAVGVGDEILATFRSTVHEDNAGALTLANMEPGRITPRSKHYAVRTHWFRSHLVPNHVEIVKIDTAVQRADILTKPLGRKRFEAVRMLLSGW